MTSGKSDIIEALLRWDKALASGDESLSADAVSMLLEDEALEGDPVIFQAPRSLAALNVAIEAGVDLSRRNGYSATVLFEESLHDIEAFKAVADAFADKQLIDAADPDGLTALSCQVKYGSTDKARVLLERGASPNAVMRNPRYGGLETPVVQQAVMTQPLDPEADREEIAVTLLEMLSEFGLRVTADQRVALAQRVHGKQRLQAWMAQNL